MVLSCNVLFFNLGLPVGCLVQLLPGVPIIFVFGKVLPDFIRSRETLRRQHVVRRNEEEGVRRNWVTCSLGLFLRILECVDIIRDALHVQMLVMNLVLH